MSTRQWIISIICGYFIYGSRFAQPMAKNCNNFIGTDESMGDFIVRQSCPCAVSSAGESTADEDSD